MSRVLFLFAFFVDLIDTTASVRDPSCLLCFLFMFAFLFPLLSRSSEPGRSAHLSPYLISFFFDIFLLIYS